MSAQSVSWWSVHEYVTRLNATISEWPLAGTPAWCDLPDYDPRKLAAVLDAGQHHALRVEVAQESRADASKAISAAADWHGISQEISQIRNFRRTRPWAQRVAS